MPILDTLHEYMGGEHYGHYLAVRCPFHGDQHPSMMVYEDTYSCKACGAHGYTENLLRKVQGGSFTQFYSALAEVGDPSLPNPFRTWLQAATLPKVLKGAWEFANNNPHTLGYLHLTRGIPERVRHALGIGLRDDFYTFPVLDAQRKVCGAFVRSGPNLPTSRYFVPKGQDPNLLYVPDWRRVATGTYN